MKNAVREVWFPKKPLLSVLYADPSALLHLPLVMDLVPDQIRNDLKTGIREIYLLYEFPQRDFHLLKKF